MPLGVVGSIGAKTIRISEANLQIVDGTGSAKGEPGSGLGNLIVGYNEGIGAFSRIGVHNIVVGQGNDYESYGGLIGGTGNTVSAPFASVVGGDGNVACEVGACILEAGGIPPKVRSRA